MKILLALSLLLSLDFVCSQRDLIDCAASGTCPKRYAMDISPCSLSIIDCRNFSDRTCAGLESNCSPREIINVCNEGHIHYPQICDRANQKITKEKYAKTQQRCENFKNDCTKRGGDICTSAAAICDPDTTIQLCKDNLIYSHEICQGAELQKEKDRAEDTKYSCEDAQKLCLINKHIISCSNIPKFCDAETAAKWCYKDDRWQIDKISDEDCSRVVKKSQYLMFEKSKPECWKQVPLCEGGNSEACMQVPTFCTKEVVSALCNAKKIKNKRVCTFAGSDKTASPSYPGCYFFADKCIYNEGEYCSLATRYCDNDVIRSLCRELKITDPSVCKRAQGGNSGSLAIPIPIVGTIQLPDIIGF